MPPALRKEWFAFSFCSTEYVVANAYMLLSVLLSVLVSCYLLVLYRGIQVQAQVQYIQVPVYCIIIYLQVLQLLVSFGLLLIV